MKLTLGPACAISLAPFFFFCHARGKMGSGGVEEEEEEEEGLYLRIETRKRVQAGGLPLSN
jgi:hypothetical protein